MFPFLTEAFVAGGRYVVMCVEVPGTRLVVDCDLLETPIRPRPVFVEL